MSRVLARELRFATAVRILQSNEIETPMTLGIFEPVIIVPEGAERWSGSHLRVVLLHELSHILRQDCLTQLIADMACVFPPLTSP